MSDEVKTSSPWKVDFASDWRIVSPSADPVARLASSELQAVLQRVTGKTLPVVRGLYRHEPAIVLSHDDGSGDGYSRKASASPVRVEMHAERPLTGERFLATQGQFVMVALDANGRPTPLKG